MICSDPTQHRDGEEWFKLSDLQCLFTNLSRDAALGSHGLASGGLEGLAQILEENSREDRIHPRCSALASPGIYE